MLRQRFPSAFSKLDRAEEHAGALREALAEYLASEPVTLKHAIEGEEVVYRVESFQLPPEDLSCIAGDALQNARAALDHLVCALAAEKSRQRPGDVKNIGLPIEERETAFRTKVKGLSRWIEPADVRTLDRANGFRGGRPGLWELHRLAIIDRHRALIVPLAAQRRMTVTPGPARFVGETERGRVYTTPRSIYVGNARVRVGMRVLRVESNVPFPTPPVFGPQVRIAEPSVFGGAKRELVEAVEESIGAARDVVELFTP